MIDDLSNFDSDGLEHQDPAFPDTDIHGNSPVDHTGHDHLNDGIMPPDGLDSISSIFSTHGRIGFQDDPSISRDEDCTGCGIGPTGPNGGPTSDPDRTDDTQHQVQEHPQQRTVRDPEFDAWLQKRWLEI